MLIPNLPYDNQVTKIKAYNDKIEEEKGGTYLWDFEEASRLILLNMKEEANMDPMRWCQYAYFITLRLKFADKKTINLVKEALYHNKKEYNETINGKETICESMQWGCDYYTAIFRQYRTTQHAKESNLPLKITIPDVWRDEHIKTEFIRPTEDGNHLIYLTKEEYHKKYGLSPVEKLNKTISSEQETKIIKETDFLMDEVKKWEIKIKKPCRKWTKKEKDNFYEYFDNLKRKNE